MNALPTLTAVMSTLFVTTLVDLTLARVNLDIQEMAKIALVRYFDLKIVGNFLNFSLFFAK